MQRVGDDQRPPRVDDALDQRVPPLEIIAGGTVALGSGSHVDEAREAARGLIGFYVGGMGAKSKNFYNDLFKRYGWEQEAETIQDLFLSGKRAEATAAVPDEFVDQGSLIGDRARIARRFRDWEDCGTTGLTISGDEEAVRFMAECARLNFAADSSER